MPETPGLQTVGLLSESQVPAQATPPVEMVREELLSEAYWMVPKTVPPEPFRALAMKFCVVPNSKEIVLLGLRVTVCTPLACSFGVPLPTQPGIKMRTA